MKELAPVGGKTNAFGIITAPNHKGVPYGIINGKPWGGDLGCLDGPDFVKRIDLHQLADWLTIMEPFKPQSLFLAGNDIVGNAKATLEAYYKFEDYIPDWPLAYCAQNGAENLPIPESCTAIFIGGMPMENRKEWKDSMMAVEVIKRDQAMGKHIHIGRVNWYRRYKIFAVLDGYENFTFDGTRTRYDGTKKTIQAWQRYQQQPPLITI